MKILNALALAALAAALAACGGGGPSSSAVTQPTASLTVDQASVSSGGVATLTWISTGATACHATDGWSGDLATSGTQSTGTLTGDTTFSLTCTSAGSSSPKASVTVTVATGSKPTATLTAAPTSVASGGTAQLTWSSTDADSCQASGGWSGPLAASGSQTVGPLTANTAFSLVCTGAGGDSDPANATVTVGSSQQPTATLTAAPASIASGATSKLTWSSTNATACTASGGWSGAQAVNGTFITPALTTTTTYTLSCTGAGGTSAPVSSTVTVTSTPKPTATLTAAPTSVASAGTSTLTWSSTNATACTASNGATGWPGTKATSGTFTTPGLTSTTTFTLVCTGAGGNSTAANATVTVTGGGPPAPTVSLTASPTAVASGGTSTLTWSSTNTTACTASNGWTGTKATSGTYTTPALTATTTFTLTCTGTGGTSAPANATVTVNSPAPTVNLQAAPTSVASGSTSTLTWTSTNATSCTASGSWTGTKATSGSFTTPALTAAATFSLTCSGSGGSGNDSVTVSIVSGSMTPGTVALTVGQVQAFNTSLSGATWSVDGVNNGNATTGTINSAGVYTAGTDTGAHTILATAGSSQQSATAIVTDLTAVTTYHYNQGRTGANTQEYALTPATVKAATFGKLASCTLDGAVVAQTLWAANLTIGGSAHNVVFVATMHNGLYAFDGDGASCTPLWYVSLDDTSHGAAAGEVPVPGNRVGNGYGDIMPEIGITSTPVIDMASHIMYVVSKSASSATASSPTMYTRLHAIDLLTGAEKAGSPVAISGAVSGTGTGGSTVAFDDKQELQRAGLALANGTVFVSFTAHEDNAPWFGWVFGYRYAGGTFTRTALVNVAPDSLAGETNPNGGGGIWMSGGAPAVDDGDNLFMLTGNGHFNAGPNASNGRNYSDSLLKIATPALNIAQYWTPSDQQRDEEQDRDFGSGGAAMLADLPNGASYIHVIACGGKAGVLEILNRDMLGGYTGATVQEINLFKSLYATPAIWNNRLYVSPVDTNMQSFTLNTTTVQFTAASSTANSFNRWGANPIVSASGNVNGVVWAMETQNYCTNQSTQNGVAHCGPIVLHAYDALNLGTELWKSSAQAADAAGYAVKFISPMVANGHVYVGTRGNNTGGANSSTSKPGTLEIYGLKP